METRASFLSCMYRKKVFFCLKSGGVSSAVVGGIVRHVDVHVQVRKLLILVAFIAVALRSGALGWSSEPQFGQLGLLLLQTLFAPLDASVLEPDFNLKTRTSSRLETV